MKDRANENRGANRLGKNGYALPAALGDTAERARPSSGEKAVETKDQNLAAQEHPLELRATERHETRACDFAGRLALLLSRCNPQAR